MGAGFERVTEFEEALTTVTSHCQSHGRTETVPVAAARGRTVAETVDAPRAVPHYDRVAVDGYAVRATETIGASDRSPVELTPTTGPIEEMETRQVDAGEPIPDGATAIVRIEQTDRRGETVLVFDAVPVGANIDSDGSDIEQGQRVCDRGERLTPSLLGLLRARGLTEISVFETPRVAVIPTGDELVSADPEPGEAVETNGLVLSTLLEQWEATPTQAERTGNDREAVRAAIEANLDHDIVVTTGGSSVGEHDFVPDVVADLGSLNVHGVALKPGQSVGFGVVAETPVFVLPGPPVACLTAAVQFLQPAVALRGGGSPQSPPTTIARLAEKLPSEPGTREFARVTLDSTETVDETAPTANPLRTGGSGALSSVAFADGWVEIPPASEGIPAGEQVAVQHWGVE